MSCELRTRSVEETLALGERLAQFLIPGMVIGLDGDLGAGKTCFVKGIARGLGIAEDDIYSPTFTLVAEHYRGRIPLYHIDLYRVEGGDIEEVGLQAYLGGEGIAIIEWFCFLPAGVVNEFLRISFSLTNTTTRTLTLSPCGEQYERVVNGLFGRG
jgi:tRNA threonylcarbamoyladenosine biosynthesis protein TsaE